MPKPDRPACIMRRVRGGLEPVSPYDAEVLDDYPVGTILVVEMRRDKNPGLLALYWHILGKVVPNTQFPNTRALSKALLVSTGHVDRTLTMTGAYLDEPASISEMNHEEFGTYYEQAMAKIYEIWGIDTEQFRRQGRNLMKDDGL